MEYNTKHSNRYLNTNIFTMRGAASIIISATSFLIFLYLNFDSAFDKHYIFG